MRSSHGKIEQKNGESRSQAVEMRTSLARKIAAHMPLDGKKATEVAGLSLYRGSVPTDCTSAAYEPELIVLCSGEKRINMGGTTLVCDPSNFLLTSIDLPGGQPSDKSIAGGTDSGPAAQDRNVHGPGDPHQEEFHEPEAVADARGMAVGETSVELLDACSRLLDLLDAPQDSPFLSNLIQREVIYRLLRGRAGHASPRHCHPGRAEQQNSQSRCMAEGKTTPSPCTSRNSRRWRRWASPPCTIISGL